MVSYGVNWYSFLESNPAKCFKIHVYDSEISFLEIFPKEISKTGKNLIFLSSLHKQAINTSSTVVKWVSILPDKLIGSHPRVSYEDLDNMKSKMGRISVVCTTKYTCHSKVQRKYTKVMFLSNLWNDVALRITFLKKELFIIKNF